jgi:hypothetical protein
MEKTEVVSNNCVFLQESVRWVECLNKLQYVATNEVQCKTSICGHEWSAV